MLDKINHNTEDAFLEDSWQKMQAILEEELPLGAAIPVKDRRPLQVLALAGLLLLIGAGLWLWPMTSFEPDPIDPKQSSVESKQAIASDFSETERIQDVILSSAITKDQQKTVTVSKEKKTPTGIIKNNISIDAASNLLLTPKTISPNGPRPLTTLADIETINTETLLLPSKALNDVAKSEEANLSSINLEGSFAIGDQLDLPTESHPALQKKENLFQKDFILPGLTNKWQVGLMAGLQLEKLHDGFGGFNAGVLLARRMGKQFGLETGLSFTLSQFNNTLINNSAEDLLFDQIDEESIPGVPENVTGTPFLRGDNENVEPLELGKASWLSVPVLLTYQPARRIRVNMGVELSHLLNAKEGKIFNKEKLASNEIKQYVSKNNIAALFGIGWYPHQNLGLDIRYNFGFTDLTKAGPHYIEQTDTRSSLQCSLVYYFGPSS